MLGSSVISQPAFTKCYYDGEIKEDKMGRTCSSRGRGEKFNLYNKTLVRKSEENKQLWRAAVEKRYILHYRESNPSRPARSPSLYCKAVKCGVD
jgi:hypothetical protein